MRRRALVVIFGGIGLWLSTTAADQAAMIVTAQLDCGSLPTGPTRTDCYISLSRLNRQQLEIAAGAAHRAKNLARYHQVTGQRRARKATRSKARVVD